MASRVTLFGMASKTTPRSGNCLPQLIPLPTVLPFNASATVTVTTITTECLLCPSTVLIQTSHLILTATPQSWFYYYLFRSQGMERLRNLSKVTQPSVRDISLKAPGVLFPPSDWWLA